MRFFSDNLEVTDSLGSTYVFASRGNAVGLQLLGDANSVSLYDLPHLLDRLPTYSFNELLHFWRNQSPLPYALCDTQAEQQLLEAVKSGDLCIFQVTDGLEAELSSATAADATTTAPAAGGDAPRQQTQQTSVAPEHPVTARTVEDNAEVVPAAETGKLGKTTETENKAVSDKNTTATFGVSTSTNYKKTFFDANPETEGNVVVHHAVEQQVQKRYPGIVSESEMHSLENLRGIPKDINSDVHLSKIRKEWNKFYRQNPSPTKEQLLDKATEIDNKYGAQFNPPTRV
ncbi:MAG: hypothetical protein VX447_19415 [Pseudomonadota bacterium]|uniref:hypothetical protein n=1 Tax=Gallaecimonas pentaromativorans TaxID=584787 RepID=UPI00067EE54B|nr:hypothetical protein [Gallaecimonas pentaromativorans]MED5526903.1 hypothetical protein [Pseudomonadota bacterium]